MEPNTNRKTGSTYKLKSGVEMRQINIVVRADIADKFDTICDGLSRSVIFSQLINDKCASLNIKAEKTPTYSILGE